MVLFGKVLKVAIENNIKILSTTLVIDKNEGNEFRFRILYEYNRVDRGKDKKFSAKVEAMIDFSKIVQGKQIKSNISEGGDEELKKQWGDFCEKNKDYFDRLDSMYSDEEFEKLLNGKILEILSKIDSSVFNDSLVEENGPSVKDIIEDGMTFDDGIALLQSAKSLNNKK